MDNLNSQPPARSLGRVVITLSAAMALSASGEAPQVFLDRFLAGDWGECSQADCEQNIEALRSRDQVFGVYRTNLGAEIWVITDAGHETTTILVPGD